MVASCQEGWRKQQAMLVVGINPAVVLLVVPWWSEAQENMCCDVCGDRDGAYMVLQGTAAPEPSQFMVWICPDEPGGSMPGVKARA